MAAGISQRGLQQRLHAVRCLRFWNGAVFSTIPAPTLSIHCEQVLYLLSTVIPWQETLVRMIIATVHESNADGAFIPVVWSRVVRHYNYVKIERAKSSNS